MSRMLVTGGAGFIGANFVHYLMQNNSAERVVVLDNLTYAGNRESIAMLEDNSTLEFFRGSINDKDLVTRTNRIVCIKPQKIQPVGDRP